MITMTTYIGTKQLAAAPMTLGNYNLFRGWVIPPEEDPMREGYLVLYPDGYKSWSPKEVFEESYRVSDGLTFGIAIELAKKGARISRKGWNGSGMYAYYVPALVRAPKDETEHTFDGMVRLREHLMLKTAQNDHATWAPSGSDVLAEDWTVVE